MKLAELLAERTPGPGTYQAVSGITEKGTQFFSKFENSRATVFNPPSSARFTDRGIRLLRKHFYSIECARITRTWSL